MGQNLRAGDGGLRIAGGHNAVTGDNHGACVGAVLAGKGWNDREECQEQIDSHESLPLGSDLSCTDDFVFGEVSSSRANGPRQCSFCVLMPISAPKPNSPPSVKRVEAFQ